MQQKRLGTSPGLATRALLHLTSLLLVEIVADDHTTRHTEQGWDRRRHRCRTTRYGVKGSSADNATTDFARIILL